MLFFGVIFMTFLRAFLSKIASYAYDLFYKNNCKELLEKRAEIKRMTTELSGISMAEEFAKYAKLQRRINKAKTELTETRKDVVEEKERAVASIVKVVNFLIYICIVLTFFYDRSVVVAQIPEEWIGWPFSSLLFWSSAVPGGITLPCWMILSSRVAQSLASEMT